MFILQPRNNCVVSVCKIERERYPHSWASMEHRSPSWVDAKTAREFYFKNLPPPPNKPYQSVSPISDTTLSLSLSPHISGMSTNPSESYTDDFLEQILAIPSYAAGLAGPDVSSSQATPSQLNSAGGGGGLHQPFIPLGLSLDNGRDSVNGGGAFSGKSERESVHMGSLFPVFEHLQPHSVRHSAPQVFHGQPTHSTTMTLPHPPAIRPRVRARRGQATDPHSIAERLRRERIAERMRALQELVPSCNKTDRAAMLDEILDYVKFLRLQVKVLSMSRLGGAGAVAQLVADIPLSSIEGDNSEGGCNQQAWDKWSDHDIEQEVAKLMEEDVGAAMQYLRSKALCIMPISLAALIYPTHPPDASGSVKPEPNGPS